MSNASDLNAASAFTIEFERLCRELQRQDGDVKRLREFAQALLTSFQRFASDAGGCVGSEIEEQAKALGLDLEAWLR